MFPTWLGAIIASTSSMASRRREEEQTPKGDPCPECGGSGNVHPDRNADGLRGLCFHPCRSCDGLGRAPTSGASTR